MHPALGPDVGIGEGDLIADKYRVVRVLGLGGMGVVVAARHLRLEELVAIKILLPEALTDADAVRRFEREARAAVKIKSEHVSRIIDVGTLDSGAPYIVMQYLDGEDLAERIVRTGPLSVEDAIELVLQACEAIAEAHTLGIVHRDLKPANLFCVQGADGRSIIKVLDFGISKFTRAEIAGSGFGMTKTAAVMGSPYYMSPEQMESPRSVDERTDIWSLGIVLYQLLTGEIPFTGETLPQVCVNVATRPAPPLRKSRPDAPNGLEAIVLRCLEKDPSKRFQSIAALATALARFGPRRAQASLDRITRTWRRGELRLDDVTGPRYPRATERPVTGPLPSWGGTAKSLGGRTRSIIGWSTGAVLVVVLALAFTRRQDRSALVAPAVLVTPSVDTAPKPSARELPSSDPIASPEGKGAPSAEMVTPPIAPASPAESTPNSAPSASEAPGAPPNVAPSWKSLPPSAPMLLRPSLPAASPVGDTESNPYAPPSEPPKPTAAPATCLVNFNAMPAATVALDGKPLGFTPKTGVAVGPGEHRVYFRWQDGEKHETFTCVHGQSRTVAVRQYEPPPADEPVMKNPYR
jgi:eukaryotic-like serine/threonine-protein kinase